jgi:hypothetical protein
MTTLLLKNTQISSTIANQDSVDQSNWFSVTGQYDGYEQVWILEKSASGHYETRVVLHEDKLFPNQYYEDYNTNEIFQSLSEACCRIPGTASPLFEGVSLPVEESHNIKDFRSIYVATHHISFYNGAKKCNNSADYLGIVTHKTFSDKSDCCHLFDYDEYLDDIREWFGLTNKQKEMLWNYSIARKCPMGFSLEFDEQVYALMSTFGELRKLKNMQEMILKRVNSMN